MIYYTIINLVLILHHRQSAPQKRKCWMWSMHVQMQVHVKKNTSSLVIMTYCFRYDFNRVDKEKTCHKLNVYLTDRFTNLAFGPVEGDCFFFVSLAFSLFVSILEKKNILYIL